MARGDVEKADLVGVLRIVERGLLDRITGVLEVDEVHAFDDAAILHIEARDDARGERHDAAFSAAVGSMSPS